MFTHFQHGGCEPEVVLFNGTVVVAYYRYNLYVYRLVYRAVLDFERQYLKK